ncbi:MAG: response regulator consisting of a CheY-like receiver domain and a winged-helix DNA-binding domain [Microbacterium sp.]|nr:response regulator consisting of a CheY-like receiver domain and a winged-helix DNA-binding domain [Microbacterium sp.]
MSISAVLDRPSTSVVRPAAARPVAPAPTTTPAPVAAAPAAPAARPALPAGSAPRGFALYVGIDEAKAAAAGVSLGTLVEALRRTLGELAPAAETYATVALAPTGAGGRDVDVVRLALHELIDGESAAFTFKEFELLQYLVLREGRTIERAELVASLWEGSTDDDAPGERTIDVHVRRLRAKLGAYEDIVRTVRGVGYRFDRHADVSIRYGHGTPSPDRF